MKAKLKLAILTIFSLSLSLTTNLPAAHHEMSDTEKVLKHHLEAFGSGDMEAILSDYTEESFVITQDGTVRGIDAIREMFTGLLQGLPPGSRFIMLKQLIDRRIRLHRVERGIGKDDGAIRNRYISNRKWEDCRPDVCGSDHANGSEVS